MTSTYSTQTKESSEQKNNTVQQKSSGVFIRDNRPSTTAALQRQEQMVRSSVHSAQRALIQKMAGEQAPMQKVENEEMLQGKFATVQRTEEDELLQGKFETVQRVEEEELLQGKFETAQRAEEEELLQGKFESLQRAGIEEEEPIQGKFNSMEAAQLVEQDAPKPNNTGLPNQLKTGIESLSGMSMDHVKVHYNSSQPAQLNAHAYAQGSDIHVALGQEQHLPHEAWHVVQQAQGRVKPTMQMKGGVPVNDDVGLETEADVMGAKAFGLAAMQLARNKSLGVTKLTSSQSQHSKTIQRELDDKDMHAIINQVQDDEMLSEITTELLNIYAEHKSQINYGASDQGGAVGFKDYAPFITIIKDRNFWTEDKVKRQATIIHELTHLAEVKSKKGTLLLNPKDDIAGHSDMAQQEKYGAEMLKLAEWMTPQLDMTEEISSWLDNLKGIPEGPWVDELLKANATRTQIEYIRERLKYAVLKEFEQPTTIMDLFYYMKAMGITECSLYGEIKSAAWSFHRARVATSQGYTLIR